MRAIVSGAMLGSLLLPAGALAAIPLHSVTTERKFREEQGKFNQRLAAEAYGKLGQHDPKWDADLTQYISDVIWEEATKRAEPPVLMFMNEPAEPTAALKALEQRGRDLYLRGCDDPLLQYLYGRVLLTIGSARAADRFVRAGADAMAAQKYPGAFVALATRDECQILTSFYRYGETRHYQDLAVDAAEEIFKDHLYTKAQRSLLLNQLYDLTLPLDAEHAEACWKRVAAIGDADPVAVLYLEGNAHKVAAWRGKADEMPIAARCFSKAWEMDQTIAEPAASMVAVARELEDLPTMRSWFERAVAARFDDDYAYDEFLEGLYPRSHGDRDLLLRFADECVATGRFDTVVPAKYQYILGIINRECDGGDLSLLRDPDVYARAMNSLGKSIEAGGVQGHESYYRSLQAALAVRAFNWNDAADALNLNKGEIDPGVVMTLRLTAREVKGAARAFTGPAAAPALRAHDLALSGDNKAAIASYGAALAANPDVDAKAYLRSRITILQWQAAFAEGGLVAMKVDDDLSGFSPCRGTWKADGDGGMIGTVTTDELLMPCEADFGDNWNFAVDVDFVHLGTDWDVCGIALSPVGNVRYAALVLDPHKKMLYERAMHHEDVAAAPAPGVADRNHVVIKRRGENITVSINGNQVHQCSIALNQQQVGFGGWPMYPADVVRFHNITIQRGTP